MRRTSIVALSILVLGLSQAFAADPQRGRDLALRWCAECHLVSSQQRQGSADVPTFDMIGGRPEFNSEKLAFFLLEPHPKMPNLPLSRAEAQDLAAYIATLSTK